MANSILPIAATDIETYVEHGYANNNGVNIHYASLGSGPLIVMIHGFPITGTRGATRWSRWTLNPL